MWAFGFVGFILFWNMVLPNKWMSFMKKNFCVWKPFCREKRNCPQSVPMSTDAKIFCVTYLFLIVGPVTWSIEKTCRAKTGCTLEVSDGTSISFEAQPFKQWFDHDSVRYPTIWHVFACELLATYPFSPSSNSYYHLFTFFIFLSVNLTHTHTR